MQSLSKTNLYEASDRLFAMGAKLADFEGSGLTGTGIRNMRRELRAIAALAKSLEHEVSRLRWNEQARGDKRQVDKILAAVKAPDSNVTLFPVVPRPAFYQDPPTTPKGAA